MKGNLRIWTWGHGLGGGAGLIPVELEGMRDCTRERAEQVTAELDVHNHWWIWIPPMNPRKFWACGAANLKAEIRRKFEEGEQS